VHQHLGDVFRVAMDLLTEQEIAANALRIFPSLRNRIQGAQ
jgi:hypothetical protein